MMTRLSLFLALAIALPSLAQGPENVLLVVNKDSKDSRAVAQYYRERRGIPAANVCTIKTLDQEEVTRVIYEDEIQKPIAHCLAKGRLQDQVLYIVLTRGVPIKVKSQEGVRNDHASVDSELAMLYQNMLGIPYRLEGRIANPYYAPRAAGGLVRFTHREFPMYLVTRLDGYDVAAVRALIDRGMAPARKGRFILDLSGDDHKTGNNWLREAAVKLKEAGVEESRIRLETTESFLTGEKDVLGYASWGSNDWNGQRRFYENQWVNGALAAQFVSTDARTFERPPNNWKVGRWSDPPGTFFAGSPQGLISDYIQEGVTGVAGHVYEPYLNASIRPQILFPAYVRGHSLAESFYAAMPFLSWQTLVVGDPLVAPFPGSPVPHEELNPRRDAKTGLPGFFAQHLARAKSKRPEVRRQKSE
jgi:uncharacterized protein (TIGR03790 family)